jgi:Right handed beta helix region
MHLFLRHLPALGGLQVIALLCAAMADVVTVNAATITVTTTADNGPGSLRDAIAAASDGDTVQFDAALNGQSIMLTSAELAVDKNITISGPGANQLAVTRSSGTFRILHLLPGHTVKIEGLTIGGGNGSLGPNGSGVLNDHATLTMNSCAVQDNIGQGNQGAGIYNDGSSATLTILNSTISGNASYGGAIGCFSSGGGLYNGGGTLTITNSVVSNNYSGQPSGPPFPCGDGGGISNFGKLTITDSTISDNTAGIHGGGIYNAGVVTITGSTVSGNMGVGTHDGEGWGEGGGIYNTGSMTITNSTLSNNVATRSGGGINGSPTISNSTISGNEAFDEGGGIYGSPIVIDCTISGNSVHYRGGGISGSPTITNSTISGNSADNGGGGISGGGIIRHSTVTGNTGGAGGNILVAGSQLEIGNTILKTGTSGANIVNNGGTVTSHGYNLSDDNGGGFLTAPGDQINTDPILGPLQNNGGSTFTHELLTGSPAIDTGDPSFTPPPSHDQRGPLYQRVFNGRLDIGSLEVQPAPSTPTPTPTPPLATPTPTASPIPAQALQLSTRMNVQTGDNVGIGGFIITGSVPKQVLLRAVGPTLAQVGIPNPLADPVMELHGPPGFVTLINDNCDPGLIGGPFCVPGTLNAGIETTLAPGAYTAIVKGKNNTTGVALVEVYNLIPGVDSRLANISTRAFVGTAADIVIAGFILGSPQAGPDRIVVRGIGPSLTGLGVPNALANPTLELRDGNAALLVANDNWQDNPDQATELTAAGLAPGNPLESGIAATLPPGLYTALLAGLNNGTGVGLVEVYDRAGSP